MLFRVKLTCNGCDWSETITSTDLEGPSSRQLRHEMDTGHETVNQIETIKETVQ